MKAGTAQKLVLNMISTATMIQLGIKGNKMVDMQLNNSKLGDLGKMIMDRNSVALTRRGARITAEYGREKSVLIFLATIRAYKLFWIIKT
jgi:N-acetylmuramic acid 6-phosphate etherase